MAEVSAGIAIVRAAQGHMPRWATLRPSRWPDASSDEHAAALREFASSACLDHPSSHAFHRALGFTEMGRVISFKRGLK